MPREITVFCREHQSSFDVEAKAQLICEIRHHSLSVGFPFSEFWQYCCDCRTFSLSDFETGGTARSECPHCERRTTHFFVCGTCKTVCYNSDEKTRGKQVELNLKEGVTPFCPACETKPVGRIFPHMCRTVEALLPTERTQCPFCLEMTEVKPVEANQVAPVAAAVMSKFCTNCGQGCESDAMFCVECGFHFSPATNVSAPNGQNQPEPMPLQTAEQHLATNAVCPNCGTRNPGISDFCGDCGHSFPQSSPEILNPSASGLNRNYAIIGVGVAVLFLVFVVVATLNSGKTATTSSSFGNSSIKTTPAANSSPSNKDSLPRSFERDYQGTIKGRHFTMSLVKDGNKLSGTASTGRQDSISGTIDESGEFRMNGYEDGNDFTGIYSGRIFNDGSIEGTWTTPQGTKATLFSLRQL